MSDRKLLETVAKLIGMHPDHWNWDGDGMRELAVHAVPHCGFVGPQWNPLTDDGDCARLEAACMLDVEWQTQHVTVGRTMLDKWQESYLLHDGDKQAARRYASVRAAAALAELSIPSQEGASNG